jgi:hypothetical protein
MEKETPTFESVWAMLHETQRRQQETALQLKDLKDSQKETDRQLKETDRQLRESLKKSKAENDRQTEALREFLKQSKADPDAKIGKWSTNHGFYAEEYFINSFNRGQRNFFGEKFDRMINNAHGIKIDAEYDILLLNGKSVAIVEVKFRAHENDIPDVINKAGSFRVNYPDFAGHRIYLGLASMSFYDRLEKECVKSGIAVIKQVGDTLVINDSNLKVF